MHRCLEVQEIVSLICIQLSIPSAPTASNNGSLTALALSCRDFKEPALDALWYHQTSLIPLVKCFPSSCWELIGDGTTSTLHFHRMPSPEEWSRVLRHAARIRSLLIPDEIVPQRPPNQFQLAPVGVWQMLEFSKPKTTTYIFPNLLNISLSEKDASLPHCRILIGPTITDFELYLFGEAQRVSFLVSVIDTCPLLTNISALALNWKRGMDHIQKTLFTRALSNAILRKDNIRRLGLGPLTPDALIHIADMNSLTDLCLFDDSPIDGLCSRPQKTFRSLRAFGYVGPSLHWVGSLFQTMDSPLIQSVRVLIRARHMADLWVRACTALHTSCPNISRLSIEEADAPLDGDEGFSVGRNILSLPIFRKLTAINLNPWGGFDIDNQVLKDVSAGWSQLESLTLGVTGPWVRPSRITPNGLIPLLVQCPQLRKLGIVFDATVSDYSLETQPDACNTKIASLDVGASPIQNRVNIAAFLSKILPCVTKITTWSYFDPTETHQIHWDSVANNMKVFTSAPRW